MTSPATPPPSAAYREPHAPSSESVLTRRFLVGGVIVLGVGAVVATLARQAVVDAGRTDDLRLVLAATSSLCGLAVFALSRATWRQLGDRAALWAGAGALAFGVGAFGRVAEVFGDQAPLHGWLPELAAAGAAMTPVLFTAGLVPGLLRARVGPAATAAVAVVGVGLTAVLMWAVPGLDSALTVVQLTEGGSPGGVAGGAVVAGAWLALATAYTLRSFRRRWLYGWAGLMLFALTLSGLAAGAAVGRDGWALGAAVLEALGALLALVGCYLDLTRAYEDQTLQLSDSEIEAEAAEARERVRAAAQRSQRHDLINAITAIDGAAITLEREFDQLSERDRASLAHVLGSGTARLRKLLSHTSAGEQVSLWQAAATVADDPAWPNRPNVEVAEDLVASGSAGETAEVVRQLVDYATRRAPTTPVTIRGEREGDWVVLRIEDRGPTMPREQRRAMFDPENRRDPDRDDTLGLRVAARLIRGQGGDLWVEARPGGGSSFGICLPAPTTTEGEADGDA